MPSIVVFRCSSVPESSNPDKTTGNVGMKAATVSRPVKSLRFIFIMLACALLGRTVAAWAQTAIGAAAQSLGIVPVGTIGNPITIGYTVSGYSGTSYTPVFKMAFGVDTEIAAPSCTGGASPQTCTVQVSLMPTIPGLIKDAVLVSDPTSNVLLAETLVYGTGTGPLTIFQPGVASVLNVGTPGGASVNRPSSVAVDGLKNVYFTDIFNHRIVKVPPGGPGTPLDGGSGLNSPAGVAVDGAGNVYIADFGDNRVVEVTAAGAASVLNVGTPDGKGLNGPAGVAVDNLGNVYIADNLDQRVVKVPPGGPGTVLNVGSPDGLALGSPNGLTVDGAGNVFIADTRPYHRVVKVPPGGPGTVLNVGSPDGLALNSPSDVEVDAAGNLYISDSRNNRVVEVTAAGVASVLNTGAPDGTGLIGPSEIALDGSGNLYIADFGNNRVVELDQATAPSLSFATTDVGSTSSDGPKTVTLVNIGNDPLNIISLGTTTTGQTTSSFNLNGSTTTCTSSAPSNSLAPAASCALGIQFAPIAAGALTGTVDITDNNLNKEGIQQRIPLSATGVAFAITILSSSVNPQIQGMPVVFTAQVIPTPANGPIPTGAVTFEEGGNLLGTGILNGGGIATFTTSSLSVGTHIVIAVYAGDSNYPSSTSSPFTLVVIVASDFAVSSSTGPQIIPPGASASFTIHIPPVNGPFTSVVTLTASGLPAGASYAFTPATVTPGANGANSTLTISVPLHNAAVGRSSQTPLFLACVLLPFAVLRRSRGRPRHLLLQLLVAVTSLAAVGGCGRGGEFNQPQQTYAITVTGTSGSLVRSTTVTLTVE